MDAEVGGVGPILCYVDVVGWTFFGRKARSMNELRADEHINSECLKLAGVKMNEVFAKARMEHIRV